MSEVKYEITEIAHPHCPWLHRIRAVRDVREGVCTGDLGGYVQSEENLSQEGQCWIGDNAVVEEEAFVYGDALIHGCSRVCGCAAISGASRIGGNAVVEDCAMITAGHVHGAVHISGNARLFANTLTGGVPSVTEKAAVYGEVGGKVEVCSETVILPGIMIDNPTDDVIRIEPGSVAIEHGPGRTPSAPMRPGDSMGLHTAQPKKRSWAEER